MRNSLRVPTSDPKRGYFAHKEAIDRAITKVLGEVVYPREGSNGPRGVVRRVRRRTCRGRRGSGTDALVLA